MTGVISAIRGIVVDLHFPKDVPSIYDAVRVMEKNAEGYNLVVEVLQLLEDGYVRGIAMGTTDGLTRGMKVEST